MTEYTVTYLLNDEQERQLGEVTELFNKLVGTAYNPAKVFDTIMQSGCNRDIDDRMAFCKKNFTANLTQGAL